MDRIVSRIQAAQVFECSLGIFQEISGNSDETKIMIFHGSVLGC